MFLQIHQDLLHRQQDHKGSGSTLRHLDEVGRPEVKMNEKNLRGSSQNQLWMQFDEAYGHLGQLRRQHPLQPLARAQEASALQIVRRLVKALFRGEHHHKVRQGQELIQSRRRHQGHHRRVHCPTHQEQEPLRAHPR